MRQWGHALLLGALLAALAWLSLRDLTFFSSDTGLRYLQVRAFEEHGWRQGAVAYAGLQFDPGMRFVPYYHAYSPYGERLLLLVSLFFPLAVAAMRSLFGPVGIVVIPVVGTLVAAGSVAAIAQLAGQRQTRWLFWGTALATPLVFYSMTLWDHTIGVGLSTAAVYMAARALKERRWVWPLAAGALVSLAVAQRADIGPMAVALGLALLLAGWPRWQLLIPYGAGGLVGLLVTAPFNLLWSGHPLGLVIARPYLGYLENAYRPFIPYADIEITRAMAATRQLLHVDGGQLVTFLAALLLVTGSIFLALVLRLPALHRRKYLYLCLILVVVGTTLSLLPARYESVNGLLTTFPLFGLALAYVETPLPGHRVYRLVFLTAWLYIGLTLLVLRAPGGGQWGGRYLLSALPLLFFLAMYATDAYSNVLPAVPARALRRVVGVLLALSLTVQLVGVAVLFRSKTQQKQWQAEVMAQQTDVILTNNALLASFMAGLEDKVFLYAKSEADLALLVQRLGNQNVSRIGILVTPALPLSIPERAGDVLILPERPGVYRLEPLPNP